MDISRYLLVSALGLAGCAASRANHAALSLDAPRTLTSLTESSIDLTRVVAEHDATVLVFWSTECPCVRRYEQRVAALAEQADPARVALYLVASNAGESAARQRDVARERGVTLPILRDEGGALAAELDARTTPTTVILRRDGTIAFRGWIDNEREPGQADRVAYVEAALGAVLSGAPPSSPQSPVFGCMITRSLAQAEKGTHQ